MTYIGRYIPSQSTDLPLYKQAGPCISYILSVSNTYSYTLYCSQCVSVRFSLVFMNKYNKCPCMLESMIHWHLLSVFGLACRVSFL